MKTSMLKMEGLRSPLFRNYCSHSLSFKFEFEIPRILSQDRYGQSHSDTLWLLHAALSTYIRASNPLPPPHPPLLDTPRGLV